MESTKATWADKRFDDMSARVEDLGRRMDNGFNRVDQDIRALRTEANALRTEMNSRFDASQRVMLQVGGGMIVTFVVGFASILVAQLA